MRPLLTVLACLLAAVASARDYSVDTAGGPLTLIEDVEAAFVLWQDAGAPELPELADGAGVLFSYGAADRFGPDTVTLTLQQSQASPALELRVNPELQRDWPAALLFETGLVLGLTAADSGVMQPLLRPDGPLEPQETDISRLLSAADALPGDLTGDGVVDFLDLLELAAAFGSRGVNLPADLDGDGTVTLDDLRLLRENYVFSEPTDRSAAEEPDPGTDGAAPAAGEPDAEQVPPPPAGSASP